MPCGTQSKRQSEVKEYVCCLEARFLVTYRKLIFEIPYRNRLLPDSLGDRICLFTIAGSHYHTGIHGHIGFHSIEASFWPRSGLVFRMKGIGNLPRAHQGVGYFAKHLNM